MSAASQPPPAPAAAASGVAGPSRAASAAGPSGSIHRGRPMLTIDELVTPNLFKRVDPGYAAPAAAAEDVVSEADLLAIARAQSDVNGLRSRRRPASTAPLPAPLQAAPKDHSDALRLAATRLEKKKLKRDAELTAKLKKAQRKAKPVKKPTAQGSKAPQTSAAPSANEGQKRKADAGDSSEKRKRKPRVDVTIPLTGASPDAAVRQAVKKSSSSSKHAKRGKEWKEAQLAACVDDSLGSSAVHERLHQAAGVQPGASSSGRTEGDADQPLPDRPRLSRSPPLQLQGAASNEPAGLAIIAQATPRRPGRAISPPRRSPSPEPLYPVDPAWHGSSSSAEQHAASLAHGPQGLLRELGAAEASTSKATAARRSPFPCPPQRKSPVERRPPAGRPEGWASDEAAFIAATPTYPAKDFVFISPGLFARSILLDPRRVRVDSWPKRDGQRVSALRISIKVNPRCELPDGESPACAQDAEEGPAAVLKQLQFAIGDQTVPGALLRSQQHQSQVSVFIRRSLSVAKQPTDRRPSRTPVARRPPDYDPTPKPRASDAALPVVQQDLLDLPCALPPDMTIAMVGRFVVASSKLCKEEGKDLFKLQLDWDDAPGNFWLAGATQGEPGWAPASSSGALTRLAPLRGPPVFIDPPTVQSQGAFGSPVPMLCSAVRCLRCGEIIVRRHWKGWRCERCNIDHKALPLLVARDVDFGRMRIDYSGPRMDNGRAMWQSGVGVQRTLQVWSDHVKIPRYDIALAAQDGDASKPNTRVWHLLSSGDVKEKASSLLRKLLKERVPYRRHLFDGVLSPFFTAAFHGSASTRTENFLRVPYTPLDEVRGIFLDTVFAVDELAGRALCPEEERRLPHNEAAFLVISGMSQDVPLHSCVGSIAHFGSDLGLILSRRASAMPGQPAHPVISLVVAHGDVVCFEDAQRLAAAGYVLTLKSKALGVTVICGRTEP